jgi:hypothetical protein
MKIKDVELKKGKGILHEALSLYHKLGFPGFENPIKENDASGTIGYKCFITRKYLVAKKSPYGDIVSVHQRIWNKAREKKIEIIMYIKSSQYFYVFKPWEIEDTEINVRGDEFMVNFGLRNGVNLLKTEDIKLDEAVEKNVSYQDRLI